MNKPILSEDRSCAIIQWNAAFTLINSLEQRLAFTTRALSEAQAQLKLVDRAEIDSLYERIEQLTNLLEDKWIKVEESLPKPNTKVLVCRVGKTSYQPFFAIRKNRELSPWEWPDGDTCHKSITHWCYIPEMPTK